VGGALLLAAVIYGVWLYKKRNISTNNNNGVSAYIEIEG
jgi:hypothetical protein